MFTFSVFREDFVARAASCSFFGSKNDRRVKLPTHLYVMAKLRMSGTTNPLA